MRHAILIILQRHFAISRGGSPYPPRGNGRFCRCAAGTETRRAASSVVGISGAVVLGSVLVLAVGCVSVPQQRAAGEAAASVHQRYLDRQASESGSRHELPDLTDPSHLPDYLAYAALNNPGLEAAFSRWKAALERVPQVRSLPDPRFNYRYFIREVETRVGPQRQAFGVAQAFPWFGKLELAGGVAAEAARAARAQYEVKKLAVFHRVKDAYYEYHYLARAIGVIRDNRDLVIHLESVARTRYKAAAIGHHDVIRAQVELGKLDDRLRSLEELRDPLTARLNAALGRDVSLPLPWPKEAPYEPVAVTDDQMLAWLRDASPELEALDHEVAGSRKAIDLAKKDYYPDVTLGFEYVDTAGAVRPGVGDSGTDPVVATMSVNIPVWAEKYAAGVREAEARHWAALKDKADREHTLSGEVKMVLYRFRDAARKINLYRDTLVPKATESIKATEAAFRTGKATFTDLVDAQRVLLEFALAKERALADHAQRLAELERLVGRTIPRAPAGPAADKPETKNRSSEGDKP